MATAFRRFLLGLALDAERGHGARLQALDADGPAALLADAVGAVGDSAERLVDLADELPLAIADAEGQVAIAFERRAVGRVGEGLAALLDQAHAVHGPHRLGHELLAALVQQLLEGVEIALLHCVSGSVYHPT